MLQILRTRGRFFFCNSLHNNMLEINSLKSRISGSSKNPEYDIYRSFRNETIERLEDIPGVTLVRTIQDAKRVVEILKSYSKRPHCWDTETIDIDAKNETAVGNGKVICASAFVGPEVNFGNGPRLFIDNFAQNSDLILYFKDYFESSQYIKIWHNYGFDRHILHNHNINVMGFGGDTMHMARLLDPSKMPKEYSLSALSIHYEQDIISIKKQMLDYLLKQELKPEEVASLKVYQEKLINVNLKTNLKKIYGRDKLLKSGQAGKVKVYPKILQMHCLPEYIEKWVEYSTLDAEVTYFLFQVLKTKLRSTLIFENGQKNEFGMANLEDIYLNYWLPLGELLTDMERRGMAVDLDHIRTIKKQAEEDMIVFEKKFLSWVQSTQETDSSQFKISSAQQLQQLLFAPCARQKPQVQVEEAQVENDDEEDGYYNDQDYSKQGITRMVVKSLKGKMQRI